MEMLFNKAACSSILISDYGFLMNSLSYANELFSLR